MNLLHSSQMPAETPGTLICQIDQVANNGHGVFGLGWALDSASSIVDGTLHLYFKNGRVGLARVTMGRAREDVANVFPDHPQAARSGLMFLAGWGEEAPEAAEFVFHTEDGRTLKAPFDVSRTTTGPEPEASLPVPLRRYPIKQALAYIRQGKIRQLLGEFKQRGRPDSPSRSPEEIELASRLEGRRCRLVIDHSMGGGANLYRSRLVSGWLAAGDTAILLSFHVASMTPFIEIREGDDAFEQTLDQLDILTAALSSADLVEIVLNCAVSFSQVRSIPKLLLDLKRTSGAALVVAIHEYFVICPSPFLLDKDGTYCGVPSISRCESCLPVHDDGFVSLTGERSIRSWREMWSEVLNVADEIRCFSQSSRRLLERAYPGIAKHATLRPHHVDPLRPVRHHMREAGSTLTIGVIGFISHHKGAGIVAELAEAISKTGANVRIVVFGSLDGSSPSEVILQTGPYNRYDLPDLLEQHKVNIALLPSICPETFSFVAHEVVSMGLPLMCLDLGAQADLARESPTGRVSPRQDGPGLLDEIMAFDRDLYFLNA